MSTAERKAREKEALKELILNGAKKLFEEKGIEQTTIRNIADEINYSIGTVYVYFKDKNAILHDLHSIGFEQLRNSFSVLLEISDPMEQLRKMGMLYIKFAIENSQMYDLMFNVHAPIEYIEECKNEDWDEGANTLNYLKQTLVNCMQKGHFKGHEVEPLAFMIWSTVHGMCTLEIRNRTKGIKFKNPETILTDGYQEFMKILDKL